MRPACKCRHGRPCRPCFLIATRADYRRKWGVGDAEAAAIAARPSATAKASTPDPGPCRHRPDAKLLAGAAAAAGLDPRKDWYACGHPDRTALAIADHVTTCQSCGPRPNQRCNPRCPGFAPAS